MNEFDFHALLASRRSYAKKSTCVLWVSSSDQFNYVAFPYLYFPGSKNTGNSRVFVPTKTIETSLLCVEILVHSPNIAPSTVRTYCAPLFPNLKKQAILFHLIFGARLANINFHKWSTNSTSVEFQVLLKRAAGHICQKCHHVILCFPTKKINHRAACSFRPWTRAGSPR